MPHKRLWIVLFALLLALLAGAVAEAAMPEDPIEQFVARWERVGGEAMTVKILPRFVMDEDYDVLYRVIVSQSDGNTRTVWRMTAHYDESASALVYASGTKVETPVNTADGAPKMNTLWQDATGSLALDSQGVLYWMDSRETGVSEHGFKRVTAEAPDAQACLEQYLRPVASMSAGDDRQAAVAAEAALRFAWRGEYWNVSFEAGLRNLSAAWQALSGEERASAEARFEDLMDVVDRAFDDYDSVAQRFDAAGVGDNMRKLTASVEAACAWEALSSMTIALNSEAEVEDDGGEAMG